MMKTTCSLMVALLAAIGLAADQPGSRDELWAPSFAQEPKGHPAALDWNAQAWHGASPILRPSRPWPQADEDLGRPAAWGSDPAGPRARRGPDSRRQRAWRRLQRGREGGHNGGDAPTGQQQQRRRPLVSDLALLAGQAADPSAPRLGGGSVPLGGPGSGPLRPPGRDAGPLGGPGEALGTAAGSLSVRPPRPGVLERRPAGGRHKAALQSVPAVTPSLLLDPPVPSSSYPSSIEEKQHGNKEKKNAYSHHSILQKQTCKTLL
ncbi:translation initiation factor IF-2-like [Penaeus chinensis]|uniref:translation initiation factor IF-2-like n=1 Tax=Penaeus chinensis TaxID=139456 RepID=UPI001FB7C836|nr:translation initiation factor IF-2-like [Penaeus chinensis]